MDLLSTDVDSTPVQANRAPGWRDLLARIASRWANAWRHNKFFAIATIAMLAAALEAMIGAEIGTLGHVWSALAVLTLAATSLVAARLHQGRHRYGPLVLLGLSLLILSVVIARLFQGSPAAVLLPMVAFVFCLPGLGSRMVWAFGGAAVIGGGVAAVLTVPGVPGQGQLGGTVAAFAGVAIEGLIVTLVLIRQRSDLSRTVKRYTSIVEEVPMGLFRTTPDGLLLDTNPWFVEMLGYPDAVALGATALDDLFVDPLLLPALLVEDRPGRTITEEVEMRRYDGTSVWARLRLRAVRGEDGAIVWFQGAARDNGTERETAAAQARLAAAVEQTVESVIITDPQARILYVNPAFERTTGYSRAEVIGENPRFLKSGRHEADFYLAMWTELAAGRTWQGEVVDRRKDGALVIEATTITPVFDAGGDLSTYVAVKRDVSVEREAELRQRRTDALLEERHRLAEAMSHLETRTTPEATADAVLQSVLSLPSILGAALIVFDIDDEATLIAAQGPLTLPLAVHDRLPPERARDLRARAAIGPWHHAASMATYQQAYGEPVARAGELVFAYLPIGGPEEVIGVLVVTVADPEYASTIDDHLPALLNVATTARLLLAGAWADKRRLDDMRAHVSSVIADAAFETVFQPVIDLQTGRAVGFEALSRFRNGQRPDRVFGEALEAGLGLELEEATLRAALSAAAGLPAGAWLSLNVSPGLLLADSRLSNVLATRTRSVVLEVTEHDAIDDYRRVRDAIVGLGADIRVAVDDAGAGIANFGHIVELRPDFVKIDIGLIRGINADLSRQAMVVGLHHFARASNRGVIAEGIETAEELATLRLLDVRYGQGYFLGRPAPAIVWAETTPALEIARVRRRSRAKPRGPRLVA